MDNLIGSPADTTEAFRAADWLGNVVAFCGHEKEDVETEYGASTVAACDLIVVFDDDYNIEATFDGWVFGAALAPTIYRSKTPVVVGKIDKRKTKNGREAWVLDTLPDDELNVLRVVFADRVTGPPWRVIAGTDDDLTKPF